MHPAFSQFGEHGAAPTLAASSIHTHLLVEMTKHLLDCLTGKSASESERWRFCSVLTAYGWDFLSLLIKRAVRVYSASKYSLRMLLHGYLNTLYELV